MCVVECRVIIICRISNSKVEREKSAESANSGGGVCVGVAKRSA